MPQINHGFGDYETTELCFAAFHGKLDLVKGLLLSPEVDIDQKDDCGHSALDYSFSHDHMDVASFLLKKGAQMALPVNAYLIISVKNDRLDIIDELLKRGADLNGAQENLWTPLTTAVDSGNVEMVLALLQRGAKLDQPGPDGLLPFHMACCLKDNKICDVLLYAGADINAKDLKGRTAWSFIKEYRFHHYNFYESDRTRVLAYLKNKGAKSPTQEFWEKKLDKIKFWVVF